VRRRGFCFVFLAMAMAEGRMQARYDRVSSVVAAVAAAMVPATGSDHFC